VRVQGAVTEEAQRVRSTATHREGALLHHHALDWGAHHVLLGLLGGLVPFLHLEKREGPKKVH
jgi:hypothetical protein